jgi:hypothetical protein
LQDFIYAWRSDEIINKKGKQGGMMVIVQVVCSVAFYCQRCGKIHIHDIPYFSGKKRISLQCSCGHEQALVVRVDAKYLEIRVPCVVCNSVHKAIYQFRVLRRLQLEKIYCGRDHFELGYIGRRKRIEELLEFNRLEFEAIHPDNRIEKQQILLEAFNRVHDIAARGDLTCPCGSKAIAADIRGQEILLECCHCGSYYVLPAGSECDLEKINRLPYIDLIVPGILKKH